MTTELTDQEILDQFTHVRVWKRGGERARHKPLLILYALARLRRGEPRLVSYENLEEPLRELLVRHGHSRESYHPEYPFWHLQSDGLWVIPQVDELRADLHGRLRQNNPPRSVLLRVGAEGGLPPDVYDRLQQRPHLVDQIVKCLLNDNWAPSLHQEILDAVGMP